jgi:hypothetical protein
MTAEHLLQTCPTYSNERTDSWEQPVTLHEKLYGDVWNLELAAAFFLSVSNSERRRRRIIISATTVYEILLSLIKVYTIIVHEI